MKIKKIWANLSVTDIKRTHEFYKALGFRLNGKFPNEYELTSFSVGEDDFIVHFFSKESFKPSLGGEIADLKNGNEVMFTLSADSKEEVDEWAEAVKKAGGTLFSKPQKIQDQKHWYGCGFADPDGHKWNVFFNGNKISEMKNIEIQENIMPLMAFVDNWKVEGVNFALKPNSPNVKVKGTQKVELMEGGKFFKADWKYKSNENEHIGISILGTDNDSQKPKMHNFDNTGFQRQYELKIEDNLLELIGEKERASIFFDKKESSYNEKWEIKKDGKWQPLCERKAIKY